MRFNLIWSRYQLLLFVILVFGSLHARGPENRLEMPEGISFNTLFYGMKVLKESEETSSERAFFLEPGFNIQSAELLYYVDIQSSIRIALRAVSYGDKMALDEVYIETYPLYYIFSLRVGRFYQSFGKLNDLQTSMYPFIDSGLNNIYFFGWTRLDESAIEMKLLFPLIWHSEGIISLMRGENKALFVLDRARGNQAGNFGYLLRLRNFFMITSNVEVDFGLSALVGQNNLSDQTSYSQIYGMDISFECFIIYLKRRVVLQTEYFYKVVTGTTNNSYDVDFGGNGGLYTYLQLQLAGDYYLQYRHEILGIPRTFTHSMTSHTVLVAYTPTSYLSLRFQYKIFSDNNMWEENLTGQISYTIGKHVAHTYREH